MAILDVVIRGPHNAKLRTGLDSSYQKTSKMTYCTTFCSNNLKKIRLPRWHLAAILDMVIQDLKMQNYMQNWIPHTTTYCIAFCDNYLKSLFSKMPSGDHLGITQISRVVQSCLSGNQAR